ncbi:MAG TPA: GTPase ObgE [Caldithrix abyssi]|uniref:GTPase Obg n=1 Tax=Caldithrix abyssi TaxID=187145 RepID=A0A7V1LMW0_CALAY|nr:GTPase ObgE [Caldithrix abyssi]
MFIDFVKTRVIAGQGGSGCMSFHREKFIDKGGPDGGDGGRGGSITLRASKNLHTLRDFTYRREYKAKRGQHGMGSNKHGRKGADILLEVPVGTIVRDVEEDRILVDFTYDGQTFVVAKGGRGGKGNARYATATHQSPREWEVGKPGEMRELELELKSIADVGLVGFPNAGKSTLLSRISKAQPKIAAYPFTTLQPNLGIVNYREFSSFVMADIPGLIEGAHTGKGLGHQFLRHVERTRVLLYMIDISDEAEPLEQLKILQNEVESYSPVLALKPFMIALTKTDVLGEEEPPLLPLKVPQVAISSVTGKNLDTLLDRLHELILQADEQEKTDET